MAYEIDLPIGAYVIVSINHKRMRYVGDGKFIAEEPIWLLEGLTDDGSEAAAQWPSAGFLNTEVSEDIAERHRRICLGYVKGEPGAPV